MFKIVSLFSGAGGFDLGFLLTRQFQFVFSNDILLHSAQTYSQNFKANIVEKNKNSNFDFNFTNHTFFCDDINNIPFEDIKLNDIDVIIGGPPCQDFSILRGDRKNQLGIKTQRGKLYLQYVKALIYLQPKIFVFENVPGLLNSNNGLAFKTIVNTFSCLSNAFNDLGINNKNVHNYKILFADIVNAVNFGTPQNRQRLIIIGLREDIFKNLNNQTEIMFYVKQILTGKNSIFAKYPLTPIEIFEGLPLCDLNNVYKEIMHEYKNIDKELKTKQAYEWKTKVYDKLTFDIIKDYLITNNIQHSSLFYNEIEKALEKHTEVLKELDCYKQNVEHKYFSDNSNCITKESDDVINRLKMIVPNENYEFVENTDYEVRGHVSSIYRKLHPLIPSYTIIAYGGGGNLGYHYKRNRYTLTNRERARLQSFPDWFLFKGSSSKVRAQIGEAVPPLLGKQIAEIVIYLLHKSKIYK